MPIAVAIARLPLQSSPKQITTHGIRIFFIDSNLVWSALDFAIRSMQGQHDRVAFETSMRVMPVGQNNRQNKAKSSLPTLFFPCMQNIDNRLLRSVALNSRRTTDRPNQ